MRSIVICLMFGGVFSLAIPQQTGFAQTRDEKVRSDRDSIMDDGTWHYDNLDSAFEAANREGKPVMAVLRCIP